MFTKEQYEQMASNAMLGTPIEFETAGEKFQICPPSFGKMQILSKLFLSLDFDEDKLVNEPMAESMRLCMTKTDTVCAMIAVATLKTKEELTDQKLLEERTSFFKWNADPDAFSYVVTSLLAQINYVNFSHSIVLTKIFRQNEPKIEETSTVE